MTAVAALLSDLMRPKQSSVATVTQMGDNPSTVNSGMFENKLFLAYTIYYKFVDWNALKMN